MIDTTVYKLIELQDTFINKDSEYPYVLAQKSCIRFRLRSKVVFNYQPLLLLQSNDNFSSILPLKDKQNYKMYEDKLTILSGQVKQDGSWEVDYCYKIIGIIRYQIIFVQKNQDQVVRVGSLDTLFICPNKVQIRKLRKMTVFPRCIGTYEKWIQFFKKQQQLGYNAFHLAPIQQTGASNSYYSLKTHLQLSSYLFKGPTEERYKQLENILKPLKAHGTIFFIDIILNHCSFDSQWIKSSPQSVFTPQNTPMLYTAFLVDEVIFDWGNQVKDMMSGEVQLTQQILKQIQQNLLVRLNSLDLYQYFMLSPQLQDILMTIVPPSVPSQNIFAKDPIQIIQSFLLSNTSKPTNEKHGISIKDFDLWQSLNICYEQNDLKRAIKNFNSHWKNKINQQWLKQIITNTINNIRYHYFQTNIRKFDDPYPLVTKYFSRVVTQDGNDYFYAVNNGWVGDNDSRQLFVLSSQFYYLRRKVNAWGDLIRLRYGQKPQDSPVCWDHIQRYIRKMAQHFDGFRLDNLHGTPIHVARYMINQARKVNPNLIIFAQLFTKSQAQTIKFVKQIGINSILKQFQYLLQGSKIVQAYHKKTQHLKPYLGSLNRLFVQNGKKIKYATRKKPVVLLYDLTHDNETYVSKKIHILQTPIVVISSIVGAFIGSTKGFDQFYSKKIDVTELRQLYLQDPYYPTIKEKPQIVPYLIRYSQKTCVQLFGSWDGWKQPHKLTLHSETSTYYTHLYLPPGQYQYKFKKQQEWILDKNKPSNGVNHQINISNDLNQRFIYKNLQQLRKKSSKISEQFFKFKLYHVFHYGNIVVVIRQPQNHTETICVIINISTKQQILSQSIELVGNIINSQIWISSDISIYQGLTTQTQISYSKNIHQYFQVTIDPKTGFDTLQAPFLPPGFACYLHCKKNQQSISIINSIQQLLSRPIVLPPLGALDVNSIFFNCSAQEQHLWGQSNYCLPNNNQLTYAGFGGVFNIIARAKRNGNLNESLFQNLRNGNWLLDYYLNRLKRHPHLKGFYESIQQIFMLIGQLSRYLIPKYFTNFIYSLRQSVLNQQNSHIDFKNILKFASSQFINNFPHCSFKQKSLFSAGLPHFSVGWARCWGRDTFTSTDILRLYPSIFRDSIIQFASSSRHGLIPNLLDQGRRPRFNSRDACWWFLYAILQYIDCTKDYSILKTKIQMLFLSDDASQHVKLKGEGKNKIMLIQEIVQNIFQAHAHGIHFRQWNAGYQIDSNMTSQGFNIHLDVHADTGFIVGGNYSNCLTWMDKMGSSNQAGTKGVPATPRAGSPVQLVGLLYSCLVGFYQLNKQGFYSYKSIDFGGKQIFYIQWADKINQNFDAYYYLRQKQGLDSVYLRGIYKDLVGSPLHYDQQRFRPNALITLAIAPQICEPSHAINYIQKVQKYLIRQKSIGISTLGQMHNPYVSYYDNNDNSNIANIAHGFSYHNGPEWVWLYGFYIVAKINFQSQKMSKNKTMSLLQTHLQHISTCEWVSLPEITNKNGQHNHFSCNAQAWSISSILMALRHIEKLKDN